MATNNAINLKSSGIVSYDGSGTFNALANPLTVPNGGSTDASLIAYAPICGGSTSTSALQSMANAGVSGQLLTSLGAGLLPTYQNPPGGYSMRITSGLTSSVTDGVIYFIRAVNPLNTSTASGVALQRLYIPRTGFIVGCGGIVTCGAGSAENVIIVIRKNNSTDTIVTSSLQLNAATRTFMNNSLGISVSAGDYIEFEFASPNWATNPTAVSISLTVYLI